jgi:hypothetical protein
MRRRAHADCPCCKGTGKALRIISTACGVPIHQFPMTCPCTEIEHDGTPITQDALDEADERRQVEWIKKHNNRLRKRRKRRSNERQVRSHGSNRIPFRKQTMMAE